MLPEDEESFKPKEALEEHQAFFDNLSTAGSPMRKSPIGRPLWTNRVVSGVNPEFRRMYDRYKGKYGKYVDYNIPGYEELMICAGVAGAKTADRLLYLGAGDGRMPKSIKQYADTIGRNVFVKTITTSQAELDDAEKISQKKGRVEGIEWELSAFSSSYPPNAVIPGLSKNGKEVRNYDLTKPDGTNESPYDVIMAPLLFQFISQDRNVQFNRIKELGSRTLFTFL